MLFKWLRVLIPNGYVWVSILTGLNRLKCILAKFMPVGGLLNACLSKLKPIKRIRCLPFDPNRIPSRNANIKGLMVRTSDSKVTFKVMDEIWIHVSPTLVSSDEYEIHPSGMISMKKWEFNVQYIAWQSIEDPESSVERRACRSERLDQIWGQRFEHVVDIVAGEN